MPISRRALLGTAATAALPAMPARAQRPVLKFGVLTDLSGPYQDLAGPVAVAAARQAVEEFGVAGKGFEVEILSADHQNKPDIGAGVVRQWIDRDGVDVILEVANSAVALAVAGVAKEKNRAYVNSGAATSDLTGAACNANTIHWVYDTYMLSRSTATSVVKTGGSTWFMLVADYAFGHALQRDAGAFVEQAGGKVLGAVRTPFPGTTDFSSFLIQAQSSGAKVLGLCNAGSDTVNSIKQAKEFGLKMQLAGLLVFLTDVHSLGLEVCQGLAITESFYWDLNDRTRAFSERFRAKAPNRRPTMVHAGTYSSALHVLKAAADMGIGKLRDGAGLVARMKAMPTDDDCFGAGTIRADGRKIHPSYLFEVKKPSESKGAWDYYKLLATTPAEEAFRPMSAGLCPLVKA
ncbi:MAG TPA: ABC transporter substrate-binding protein [Acetobacteraceae bacterium]